MIHVTPELVDAHRQDLLVAAARSRRVAAPHAVRHSGLTRAWSRLVR